MTTTPLGPAHRLDAGRVRDLVARVTGDEKHDPSAHSTLDVVRVLYDRVLRVDPAVPEHSDRDRFVLSKGHGPALVPRRVGSSSSGRQSELPT